MRIKQFLCISVFLCLTCFQLFADNLIDNFKIYNIDKEVMAALKLLYSEMEYGNVSNYCKIPENCFENDDYIFNFMNDGSGIIIYGYKGDKKDVSIPNEIEGFPVTEIACFGKSVERIVIPKTVKEIGPMAFLGCGIKKVDYEENSQLEKIGKRAFAYNRLSGLSLPRKEIKIYSHAYFMNPIKEINYYKGWKCWKTYYSETFFDDDFIYAGISRFGGSRPTPFEGLPLLEKVVFEEGCERVEEYMFSMCPKLSQVEFSGTMKYVFKGAFSSCPSLKKIVIPDKVNKISGAESYETIFDGKDFDIEIIKKLLKAGFTMENIGR